MENDKAQTRSMKSLLRTPHAILPILLVAAPTYLIVLSIACNFQGLAMLGCSSVLLIVLLAALS